MLSSHLCLFFFLIPTFFFSFACAFVFALPCLALPFAAVYRITPRNYTGLTNLDSGNSRGDVFFGIYEVSVCDCIRTDAELVFALCGSVYALPLYSIRSSYYLWWCAPALSSPCCIYKIHTCGNN